MTTLRKFSEKERDYHEYQARQNFIREQRTMQKELEAEREGRLAALAEKDGALEREKAAITEKQEALYRERSALAEIARLKALLEQGNKLN